MNLTCPVVGKSILFALIFLISGSNLITCEVLSDLVEGAQVSNVPIVVENVAASGTVSVDQSAVGQHYPTAVALKDGTNLCSENWCSSLDESELLALDAIRTLHRQIDDDKNGNIDFDESDEFLREELMYEGDYEKRQRLLHQDDDNHVSVKELWDSWVRSDVHNWTTEQTVEWLSSFVGLPQYSKNFLNISVNGSALPRLATNHLHVLSNSVGIKDLIHRQKIALKAQEIVLFGYTHDYGNRTKDSVLTTLLVLALSVCWFVYSRYKISQRDLNKMIVDMDSLAKAEQALIDLQKELEKARTAQQEKAQDAGYQKKLLEDSIPCSEEILRLKGEVEVLRSELQRAEVELQDKCWVPPPALQHWLQLTYELELKAYNRKRQAAEKQLKLAKDACDKLKKRRTSFMGAFVSTHGRSIDDVDKAILEARTALTEITQELKERTNRWKQIETLINCPIMNNPGLPYLEAVLRGVGRGLQFNGPGSVISNSQDDIDDDGASSIYCPSAVQKLISTSTYLMYPGHDIPFRSYPTSSASIPHKCEANTSDSVRRISAPSPNPCNSSMCTTSASCDPSISNGTVSAPSAPVSSNTGVHAPMVRSKSVSSMISLREKAFSSREGSSKDSSTGEDEINMDVIASELTSARDRRVTFGVRTDHRELFASGSQPRQLFKEKIQKVEAEAPLIASPNVGESTHGVKDNDNDSEPVPSKNSQDAGTVNSLGRSIPINASDSCQVESTKQPSKIWDTWAKGFRLQNNNDASRTSQKAKADKVMDKGGKKEKYYFMLSSWSKRHFSKSSIALPTYRKSKLVIPVRSLTKTEKAG